MKLSEVRKEISSQFSKIGFQYLDRKFVRRKEDFYQVVDIHRSKYSNDLLVSFGYYFPDLSTNGDSKIPESYNWNLFNSVQAFLQDVDKRKLFIKLTSNYDEPDSILKSRIIDLFNFLNDEIVPFFNEISDYKSLFELIQDDMFYYKVSPQSINREKLEMYFVSKMNPDNK